MFLNETEMSLKQMETCVGTELITRHILVNVWYKK